jgi:hypothetical protein
VVFGTTTFRGWLARAEVSLELMESVKLGAGAIIYRPEGQKLSPLSGFERHDLGFVNLRWDFRMY